MDHTHILLIVSCFGGFLMAFGIGANDVANAMGTSVGSKALTIKQAIIIAAIFEFAGALFAGGEVADTIRSNIITPNALLESPDLLVYGMLAAIFAAGTWLLVASHFGWPVSTTHSIVGAIIGFGVVGLGASAIRWAAIGGIVASWIVTPLIAGVLSYLIFMHVQHKILNRPNPGQQAKKYVPFYIFIGFLIISQVTILKGLTHLGLNLSTSESLLISIVISIIVASMGRFALQRTKVNTEAEKDFHFANVERIFGILMVFTACAMAFAHGSNDVANAIGPLAAIIQVLGEQSMADSTVIPVWLLWLGGLGIVLGLATLGYRVMNTVGKNITQLTPSRGFAAQLSTASTVLVASGLGLPVSTTQILVGAILGVGLARGIGALNLNVVRNIFMSWVITLPSGAILAVIFFYIIKAVTA